MHTATSVLWGALYDRMRALRRRPGRLDACTDALLLAAVAAGLDRVVRPTGLTPGADKRPSSASLWTVYGGFAAGLALGGLMALRHNTQREDDNDDDDDDRFDAPAARPSARFEPYPDEADDADDRRPRVVDHLHRWAQHLLTRPTHNDSLAALEARASQLNERLSRHLAQVADRVEDAASSPAFGRRA